MVIRKIRIKSWNGFTRYRALHVACVMRGSGKLSVGLVDGIQHVQSWHLVASRRIGCTVRAAEMENSRAVCFS